MQETINGFPIIAQWPIQGNPEDGRVFVAERGEAYHDRFVVSTQYKTDGVWNTYWNQGHYCSGWDKAWEYFTDLVESHTHFAPRYFCEHAMD